MYLCNVNRKTLGCKGILSVQNRILQKNQFQMQSKQFHNFRNVIQHPLLRNSILQRRNVVPQPRNVIIKE